MRVNGNFNFPINFEPTGQMILDARLTVPTRGDLVTAYTEKKNYYPKMVVTVEDENALYMLTGSDPAQSGNWTRLDAGATTEVSVENVLTSTSTTNALSAAMGKKLNDEKVAKTTTVNGKPLSSNVVITSTDIINENDPSRQQTVTAALKQLSDNFSYYVPTFQIGQASGVAGLDSTGKVPSAQLPSYVDDVLEYNNKSSFPETGESGKIYIAKDTNLTYRWSGSVYVEISQSLALGETSSTAYAGNKGKANADNISKIINRVGSNKIVSNVFVNQNTPDNVSLYLNQLAVGIDNTSPQNVAVMITKATTSAAGVMSATDKSNLDNVVSSLTWKEIE